MAPAHFFASIYKFSRLNYYENPDRSFINDLHKDFKFILIKFDCFAEVFVFVNKMANAFLWFLVVWNNNWSLFESINLRYN